MSKTKKNILNTEEKIISKWKNKSDIMVSIICVTYNHEDFIEDAICGFLLQITNFAIEIIIHDDASTDGTTKIIECYQKKYPNIIKPIFQKENQFSKGNFRPAPYCEKLALGKYIARCDGDDYWQDEYKLRKQVDFLEANPNYVIVYGPLIAINNDGDKIDYIGGACKDLTNIELKQATPINTLSVCFRNMHWELPSEFSITPIGDLFYWSLLGHYGSGKYLDSISPCVYRIHNGGVFSKINYKEKKRMLLRCNALLFSYYSRIGDEEMMCYFENKIIETLLSKTYIWKIFYILTNKIKNIISRLIN